MPNISGMNPIKKLLNTRFVLNTFQTLVGANQWKSKLYPPFFKKGGSVLDFGCSYGNTTPMFLDYEYYGVDIDPHMIQVAKNYFKDHKNVHFDCVNILEQDYKPNFFDSVLFASTSHHISNEDIHKILEALLENLKLGGELHFFDIIRQDKDPFTTRMLTNLDQGEYIRTLDEYEKIFDRSRYPIVESKIVRSPKAVIQLWDFLYVKMVKK